MKVDRKKPNQRRNHESSRLVLDRNVSLAVGVHLGELPERGWSEFPHIWRHRTSVHSDGDTGLGAVRSAGKRMSVATLETAVKALDKKVDRLILLTEALKPPPIAATPAAEKPDWSCDFTRLPWLDGMHQQEVAPGKITLVNVGGRNACRLHTEPGDTLYGTADTERTQLKLPQELTDGYEGRNQWWAWSTWFPDDFTIGTAYWYVVQDFHHASNSGNQSNFHVDATRGDGETLRFRLYGEGMDQKKPHEQIIGPIKRNQWYDFVLNVRWTSKADGFSQAWVNGKKVLDYKGPTLYKDDGVYGLWTNYHEAMGKPTSIIHSRIVRGKTWQSVALAPLEGVT